MPTGGLGPFRRFLLGSVAAKVLHDTAVPVWRGVHSEEIAAHTPDRKKILCALEDDPRDLPVLQWAAEFASEQKLELRLVHAVLGLEESGNDPSFRQFIFQCCARTDRRATSPSWNKSRRMPGGGRCWPRGSSSSPRALRRHRRDRTWRHSKAIGPITERRLCDRSRGSLPSH
jgi:hypothetical protein